MSPAVRHASLFAVLLIGCGAEDASERRGSVDVGVAVPLTSTDLMIDAQRAWQLVVDQVNEGGGINDETLAVHARDTPLTSASDLAPIADGFVELTNEGYKYIISLVSGSALAPMMDAAMPHGVLTMSITSEESAADVPEYDGMLAHDPGPAVSAGLRLRSVAETAPGCLDSPVTALTPEREAEVLAAWHAR